MALTNEIEFENDLSAHLADNGWLYSKDDTGYDRERALFPADSIAWIQETQPKAWERLKSFHNGNAEVEFLNRLVKVMESDGTLTVLKQGFKAAGAGSSKFEMVQFKPAFGFNAEIAERYEKNRVRVMRQVHYSTSNQKSIDLVLFVNGIPVATIEVKTDFTQAVEIAKEQYKKDRLPKDEVTGKVEPLLTFKRGALVHFAVSTFEVWMTTKLEGSQTFFLPFNKGNAGGKGNPPNPLGYPSSYLWEEVLQRDSWLKILGSFIQFESKTSTNAKGYKTVKESIIFPRYHQLNAVNKLIEAAKAEGAGNNYLFQHSAGSGKSNTIGWCAHQLSTLYDAKDNKVFDSVIVITDRTVLDAQLKETVSQFQSTPGVVATIDSASGSKSGQLSTALKNGALIIVVTLQTFPFVLKEIKQSTSLEDRRFAVIIDEAHSSQSGSSARHLRGVLGAHVEDGGDDEEEITAEDLLLAEAETRPLPKNVSFLAFTATPKNKTLEVFGRRPDKSIPASKTNAPLPFHLYTMKQAIEEGFILDVLRNFTPYKVAYRLAHNGADWDDKEVTKSEGMKALARWVRLHPHNISQKVQIIVEHFRENVGHRLDGRAKAMVVTNSRQEAVRYKLEMDKYIAASKYTDIRTLVAFSGDVLDASLGPEKFNEVNMNKALLGQGIREAFATDDYQVLIVANKFQTGFDQPLLVSMYVDKRIDGITAVQTLSRLNRTYPGKDTTFILDFVNDAETIKLAFDPYYESTELQATTDPNLVYDLQSKLDGEAIYTQQEAENVAAISIKYSQKGEAKQTQKDLFAALSAPVDRFKRRWIDAEGDDNKEEIDRLTIFHKNLGGFCRLYDFLSQIVSYNDSELEARYHFFRALEPLVRPERVRTQVDLSNIELTHYKIKPTGSMSIVMDGGAQLPPITALGTAMARDPEKAKLSELIQRLNDLFNDGSLTEADTVGFANHIAGKMLENEEIVKQGRANTRAQFHQSPTITSVGTEATIAAMDNYAAMSKKVFETEASRKRFIGLVADYVYDQIQKSQDQPGAST